MSEIFYYIHKSDLTDISVLAECNYVEAFHNTNGTYIEFKITAKKWTSCIGVYLIEATTISSELLCILMLHGIIYKVAKEECSPNILSKLSTSFYMGPSQ